MGKKGGSSAPPPDPRLVEAQIKSMGLQDEVMQAILAQSKDLAPLQREQLQLGLDAAKLGQDQSQADRAYALERRGQLSTLQDAQIKEATDFNTDARREQLAQQAGEDASGAFAQGRSQLERNLAARGVKANSGAALAMSAQTTLAEAMAKAGAINQARQAARMEGRALTDRATNSLAGYPSMGTTTTGAGVQYGTAGTTLANSALAGLNSGFGAAGQVAGQMGSNATNMWNAQANYQNNMIKNNNEAGNGMWGALGSLAGAAAKFGSMRNYKTQIKRIGTHPLGMGLYTFKYKPEYAKKWGEGTHTGVMADELLKVKPSAISKDSDGHTVVDYGML